MDDGYPGYNTRTLGGNFSSKLVDLRYLSYLDLSCISFYEQNSIPSFIGSLSKLRYLNLSYTTITGEIPSQLGNLSSLQILDLRDSFKWKKTISNPEWISHLSSLQLLDLSYSDMSLANDWVRAVNNLPRLTDLKLSYCDLPSSIPPSLSPVNSSKVLATLDLSGNHFSTSLLIHQLLFNYNRSLVHVDLSLCSLKGSILEALEDMFALEYIDLTGNDLGGSIPKSFGINMTSIAFLALSNNQLQGSIPEAFGNMTSLEYLDVGENRLEGEIPKSIWEICALKTLRLHDNNLSGELWFAESSSRCAHFSLESLLLENNQLTGSLPNFTLYPSLKSLWLSSNKFNGNVSESVGQ